MVPQLSRRHCRRKVLSLVSPGRHRKVALLESQPSRLVLVDLSLSRVDRGVLVVIRLDQWLNVLVVVMSLVVVMIELLDHLVCRSHQGRILLVIVNVPTLILVLVACRRHRRIVLVVV